MKEIRGIFNPNRTEEELLEVQLRPRAFVDYIGQRKVTENVGIAIEAAKGRKEALDHTLLYGPPGLGKTTLAVVIASEMGVNLRTTSGPAIEKKGDLAAILTNLEPMDILFIDEIHRLLDIILDKGANARTIQLKLPHFTLVGATTRAGLLTSPLRARFGVSLRLDYYSPEELHEVVLRSARILGYPVDAEAAREIARRSRGTPRVANRLLRRVRDYAQVRGDGCVDAQVAEDALAMMEVDHLGLDVSDKRVLQTLIDKFDGGPVGLDTIAASLSEDPDTIMDVYEPYLLQLGFLERTPRGRVATRRAYEHLGRVFQRDESAQARLF